MATKESIEQKAAELGITMTAEFVPWSLSRSSGQDLPSLNWKVSLRKAGTAFLVTDYTAGCAHCPSYKQGRRTVDEDRLLRWECENGRAGGGIAGKNAAPLLPSLADVLYSLASDADVIDYASFEAWAEENGYDADSRKAEATYRQCLDVALRLRAALGEDGLAALLEAVRDY